MSTVLEKSQTAPRSDDAIPDDPAGRLYRLSVEQYHAMARAGVFAEDNRVELLEGLLVRKMTKNGPHVIALNELRDLLLTIIGDDWRLRIQDPVALDTSEPEPDLVVTRGTNRDYVEHPTPADCGLVVEVADRSLCIDRVDKKTLYARNGVAEYWIVNLIDNQIEVYTQPSGRAESPDYASRTDYKRGDAVPFRLEGTEIGTIAVGDVLP